MSTHHTHPLLGRYARSRVPPPPVFRNFDTTPVHCLHKSLDCTSNDAYMYFYAIIECLSSKLAHFRIFCSFIITKL